MALQATAVVLPLTPSGVASNSGVLPATAVACQQSGGDAI